MRYLLTEAGRGCHVTRRLERTFRKVPCWESRSKGRACPTAPGTRRVSRRPAWSGVQRPPPLGPCGVRGLREDVLAAAFPERARLPLPQVCEFGDTQPLCSSRGKSAIY